LHTQNKEKTMFKRISLLAVVAAVIAAGNAAHAFDEITAMGKPIAKGQIRQISPKEVAIEVSGRLIKFSVNEIISISFDEDPLELKAARRSVKNGQFGMAMEKLAPLKEGDVPEIVGQDIQFYKAYCTARLALGGSGSQSEAYSMMGKFIQGGGSQSYHFYPAAEVMGDLAAAMGDYKRAETAYGVVAKAPWPDYKMRAAVLEARALVAQGKHELAEPKFDDVIKSSMDSLPAQKQKLFAKLGKAACLAEKGEADQALKMIEAIIAKEDPKDITLFARAYTTQGRCYLVAKKPKDALLAFLHVDILFYGDPESHAEALYYLSKLWKQVDKSERALKARGTLKTSYPGSVWAKKE